MPIIEEKVSALEMALLELAQAQKETELHLQRLERNTELFQKEMRAFREEMRIDRKQFKEEMRTFREEMRTDREQFKEEMRVDREQSKEEMQIDREQFKEEMRTERKNMNKSWGDLANKMGTIVEDIVAPSIPYLAGVYFGCLEDDLEDFMVRRWIRNKRDRSKRREFDVVAVYSDKVLLSETKSTPRISYIDDFIENLPEIKDYFPEFEGKRIIPIFASLYMGQDVINYLTRHGIYAMIMGEEMMDLVNFNELSNLES